MDLLTAVAHELEHLLGSEHSDDGTMHDPGALGATGERHMPTSSFGVLEPILANLILFDKRKAWVNEPLPNDPLHDLVALLD